MSNRQFKSWQLAVSQSQESNNVYIFIIFVKMSFRALQINNFPVKNWKTSRGFGTNKADFLRILS